MVYQKPDLKVWTCIFIIWAAVMLGVFYFAGFDNVYLALKSVNYNFIGLAILSFALSISMIAINLQFLISRLHARIRFRNTVQIVLTGQFIDNILPNIAPGGELTMAYLLHKREKVPFPKAFAAIALYMISWFTSLIVLAVAVYGILLFTGMLPLEIAVLAAVALTVFLAALVVLVRLVIDKESAKKIIFRVINTAFALVFKFTRWRNKKARCIDFVDNSIDSFIKTFGFYTKNKMILVVSFLNILMHHFFFALSFYFVLLAFGIKVPLIYGIGLSITIGIFSMITFIPGQFGVYELVSISLLSFSGGLVDAAIITVILRLLHYWSLIIAGGFFAVKFGFEELMGALKVHKKLLRKGVLHKHEHRSR
ncbi:MAG: lysylphosphatidylglycerol synthase transmembrane domain-containing protein [Candidatus Micrarchaeota archaeon]